MGTPATTTKRDGEERDGERDKEPPPPEGKGAGESSLEVAPGTSQGPQLDIENCIPDLAPRGQKWVKFRSKSGQKGGPNRVGVSGIWGGGHEAGVAL